MYMYSSSTLYYILHCCSRALVLLEHVILDLYGSPLFSCYLQQPFWFAIREQDGTYCLFRTTIEL